MGRNIRNIKCHDVSEDIWRSVSDLRDGQKRYSSPFFSTCFFEIVGSVRDDLILIVKEDADGLAMAWPIHLSFLRRARGVGGPFSDRNGPILRSGTYLDIPGLLAKQNIESLTTSGLCHTEMSETSVLKFSATNGTDLVAGYDAFFDSQKQQYGKFYKRLGRLSRKLERDFSEVEYLFDDHRDETFDALIKMKRAQFIASGRHDVLQPDWVIAMLDRLRAQENINCRPRLASLYVNGTLAAVEFNLQSQKVLHGWIVAYDPDFSQYSPGNLLTQFILQNLISNGMTYYDSGIDGDHYKKYITNHRELVGVGVVNPAVMIPTTRRVLGKAWNTAELLAPEKISTLLSRTRRRSEQILATEVDVVSRFRGYYSAISLSS